MDYVRAQEWSVAPRVMHLRHEYTAGKLKTWLMKSIPWYFGDGRLRLPLLH